MGAWQNEKKERELFWRDMKNTESLEGYVEEITELVVKDKIAVATKHTANVAAHLRAGSKTSSRIATLKKGDICPPLTKKGKVKSTPKVAVPQLPEPWKALMEVALALNHDRDVDIPEDCDISHLSPNRQQLYRLALDSLRTFKHDKQRIIAKKDASLHDYFEDDFLTNAADAYHLPTPKNRTATILDPLLKLLAGRTPRFILEEVRVLKGRYQEKQRKGEAVPERWEAILDVVEHVCQLVLRPSFEGNASEADVVAEWKAVINMLLRDSSIYMRSGECVSKSSKDIKALLDAEYDDFGSFGRKVDLTMHAHGLELANLEFKVGEAKDLDIKIQNRKNIRLNRAIMEAQHEACGGIKSPILFFDFQGWHGSLFALYAYEDIFVSKYLGPVALPRSRNGLKIFLQGETLQTLFMFTDHLVAMAEALQESREEREDLASKKRHMAIFTRQVTPPSKERRVSGNVFLTPTKRK
ncbi:hypothetical protein BGZ70_009354 [Mortierella alpina]|uniref:Uncharacterized protein n=1 Tax=Mortierella alpina TaxID=64518 RepID=A0A9P6M0G2_MORAP|nr:hypothetical protein BGZ70_009354 [Mortierella alpina]